MAIEWAAARRAWTSFSGAGPMTMAFLLARGAVAPLGPMGPELAALRGHVLSLGSGHGLVERYLVEINPEVTVEGVDLDEARVAAAQTTSARHPRLSIRTQDVTKLDEGATYDAALAVDVMHHVPFEEHARLLRALHDCLRPGATLLVKEMASKPRRQYLWNRFHDRIVAGPDPISCRLPDEMAELVEQAGFEVRDVRRLERLHIYPQYLVRAERAA